MKKRWLTTLACFAMCLPFAFAACGETSGGNQGGTQGGNEQTGGTQGGGTQGGGTQGGGTQGGGTQGGGTDESVNITMYTSVNIIEQNSLQMVANAYEDYQYGLGKDITITIINNTDPDAYGQTLRNLAGAPIAEPTIASVAPIPEYHGTDKIVDLSGYLEEETEYSPDFDSWMDSLEPDAYRTVRSGSKVTIPGISYSSNYTCMFYDKNAMKTIMAGDPLVDETGTIDTSRLTWSWIISALQRAKGRSDYPNPLGLSRSMQSCGQVNFNFITSMINMYLDQYFRDFIDEVHSKEGDYSYIPSIDGSWTYDANDYGIDLASRYSYNFNQIVDKFFNQSETYGPESARYKEVMENLWELVQYSDPEASYHDNFNRFNETTIVNSLHTGGYVDMKLFYVETLGYVRTYRDAFNDKLHKGYPSAEEIDANLGWFLLPPMESDLPGVAENVRAWGGPLENYGVLSTGSAAKDEVAVDFLKFLTSPLGQEQISANYDGENHAPQVMRQLVKNIRIPETIDYTSAAMSAGGDSNSSPYLIFGYGNGLSTSKVKDSADYVRDKVAEIVSGYFIGSAKAWNGTGLLNALKSGFADYAKEYNLIYTDPANVAQATNGLKGSPYNTTA